MCKHHIKYIEGKHLFSKTGVNDSNHANPRNSAGGPKSRYKASIIAFGLLEALTSDVACRRPMTDHNYVIKTTENCNDRRMDGHTDTPNRVKAPTIRYLKKKKRKKANSNLLKSIHRPSSTSLHWKRQHRCFRDVFNYECFVEVDSPEKFWSTAFSSKKEIKNECILRQWSNKWQTETIDGQSCEFGTNKEQLTDKVAS